MARSLLLAILLLCSLSAEATFDDANPIRLPSESFADTNSDFTSIIGATPSAFSFVRFAKKHHKNYTTEKEIKHRFDVFSSNLNLIKSTNSRQKSYRLHVNHFADLTWEEFRSQFLGASQKCSATRSGNHKLTNTEIPETKDWREDGIVSPVKNQLKCGSCWTFSTTGALEAAYHQAFGRPISLSEQQLVDCAGAFNNFGCDGGLPSQAFEYLKYNGGLDTEESYPYVGVDGVCSFSNENVGVKVVDSVNITEGAEDELKQAVATIRPVSVAFEVLDDFFLYESGVYTSAECGSTVSDVNHAVLAVGYGVENGVPYWLIKNSWGAEWGVGGYFKMEMGKNMCGVATCASYPVVA